MHDLARRLDLCTCPLRLLRLDVVGYCIVNLILDLVLGEDLYATGYIPMVAPLPPEQR